MQSTRLLVVCIVMLKLLKQKAYTALRASEKYTKTDMVYLTKGGFWMLIGNIVSISSVFITAIAFAHFVPKEIYGIYKFVLAAASILMFFSLSGLPTAVTQAVARGYEGTFRQSLKTRIMWGVLGSVCSLLVAGYYYIQQDTTLAYSFLLIAFFVPFFESIGLYENFLLGKQLFKNFVFCNVISRIISVITLVLTILFSDNLFLIIAAYFIPPILIKTFFDIWTIKHFSPNNRIDEKTITYGKHLSVNGVIAKIALFLDTILVFHFLGPLQVALYSFALAPIEQIRSVYKSIPLLTVPKFANQSPSSINTQLNQRLLQLCALGLVIGIVYFFAAPLLFTLLFSTYMDSVVFSQWLAILLVISLPNALLESIQQAKLDITPTHFLYLRNIPSIILIISLLICTPFFGITGVIISRTIYTLSTFTYNYIQWNTISYQHETTTSV